MTVPIERTRAVVQTEDFLKSLLDVKSTPRIPKHIRRQALDLLRHYPSKMDMEHIANKEDGVVGLIDRKVFGNSWL